LPGNKTGAQLTFEKPFQQNFLSFNCTADRPGEGGGQR